MHYVGNVYEIILLPLLNRDKLKNHRNQIYGKSRKTAQSVHSGAGVEERCVFQPRLPFVDGEVNLSNCTWD